MLIKWKSQGAASDICRLIAFFSVLTLALALIFSFFKTFAGNKLDPPWYLFGTILGTASIAMLMAEELSYKKIRLSPSGLSFSPHYFIESKFRLDRPWKDIGAVSLEEPDTDLTPNDEDKELRCMVFHFISGGRASIFLKDLNVSDLNNFFRASKTWGSTAVISPELIELRRKLTAGPDPLINISLTKIWEKELFSQFSSSTFVPLATGTYLQNKRFMVIGQIAAGGLSAIYLARDSKGDKVILKELVMQKSQVASFERAKEHFIRECKLLSKLKHPEIAHILDYFVENNRDYLVLEYIPGQTLRQYVNQHGPINEDKVLDWALAITSILNYLHTQDPPVIHRDITPENLLLGDNNKIYLIDFGAANDFISTATGTLVGKQAFIPPEQFKGKAELASDIYALGATIYFLLTGEDPEALTQSHPIEKNNYVSTQVNGFIAEMTNLDPCERPPSAQIVSERLLKLKNMERNTVISLRRWK